MLLLRLAFLILYGVGFGFLYVYLRDHPPRSTRFVQPMERPLQVLFWMWGPLLAFVPGLLWLGVLRVGLLGILLLSVCVPLSIFMVFLLLLGVFPASSEAPFDALFSFFAVALPPAIVFLTLVVTQPPLPRFLLFVVFMALPTLLSILLLMAFAPDIIPMPREQPNRLRTILLMIAGFFSTFPKPTWVIEDGKIESRVQGNQFFGVGPGWLLTEPENVVVLRGGTDIQRIVGPGVVLTKAPEVPFQVVDLRNQIRTTRINAITKDGIEVRVPLASLFRIDRGPRKSLTLEMVEHGEPWPYHNQRDIYHAVFAEEVNPTDKTPLEAHKADDWDDLPLKLGENKLRQVLLDYPLRELYNVNPETGQLKRNEIGQRVREYIKAELEKLGFEILGGSVGNKVQPLNPAVTQQRIEAWKAQWMNKIMEWETEVEAKRLEDLTTIRRETRLKSLTQLIEDTNQRLEDSEYYTTTLIAYQLLETLMHIAQKPKVKDLLPDSVIPTLTQLHQQAEET
jgi:hypothetical protein